MNYFLLRLRGSKRNKHCCHDMRELMKMLEFGQREYGSGNFGLRTKNGYQQTNGDWDLSQSNSVLSLPLQETLASSRLFLTKLDGNACTYDIGLTTSHYFPTFHSLPLFLLCKPVNECVWNQNLIKKSLGVLLSKTENLLSLSDLKGQKDRQLKGHRTKFK